ncbi:N-6 DNA methylase, partial [Methylotuvimicrobium alcaliphilum]|uniref:site-specific DNA-methyltransferase (adenine-specific) n=1 Tax=Methylotuvimicrobium alcaliphilum (strain DSM 19304 / NCIMB 14124 / VKM B-2133 / 20Z) TaxID=1091494 RepID=G4T429_META2
MLFIDASRDYQDVKNQNRLRQSDIDKIVATYRARESVDKYAYLASFDEIKDNDFNLNIPRYVDTFEEEAEIDIDAVQAEISQLESELEGVKQEMTGYLKELGYKA